MDSGCAVRWLAVSGQGHALKWRSEVTVGQKLARVDVFSGLFPHHSEFMQAFVHDFFIFFLPLSHISVIIKN